MIKNRYFIEVYSIIIFILFSVSAYYPLNNMWGINQLQYINSPFTFIFVSIFLIGLLLSFTLKESVIEKANQVLKNKILFSLFLIILSFCFYLFRVPTHFLGDGYTWIANYSFNDYFAVKPTEYLSSHIVRFIQSLTGTYSKESSLLAFQLISFVSGIVFLILLKNITKLLFEKINYRILSYAVFLFSGAILLFFGYVEFYPMYWMSAAFFIFASLKSFESKVYLFVSIAAFFVMLLIHGQGIYFTLGFVYILTYKFFETSKAKHFLKNNASWIILMIIILSMTIMYIAYSNTKISQVLLPVFSDSPNHPGYFVISLTHLHDILNQILLVSPLFLLFFLMCLINLKKIRFDKVSIFLLLTSIGSIGFLFFVNPNIGFQRDWDLMSFTLFCPTLLVIYLLSTSDIQIKSRSIIVSISLIISISTSFVALNNDTIASVNRYRDILNAQEGIQFRPGWAILNNYYIETGQIEKSNEVKKVIQDKFKEYEQLETGLNYLTLGKYQEANQISVALINRFPHNIDFVQFRAKLFVEIQMLDSAKYYIDHGFQIQSAYPALLKVYGEYLIRKNDYPGALNALEKAYMLTHKNIEMAEPLALCYIRTNKIQDAIGVAKDVYNSDKNSPSFHIISLMIYIQRNDISNASEHYKKFLELGQNRSDYNMIKETYKNLLQP